MLNFSKNNLNNEGRIRTVLDVGCGVASFRAYLLSFNIIAIYVAPNDVHPNQIQFSLEKGIPTYLGVLGTKRLPYPSRSFELAHCSHCRINWLQRDGILILELDRLLKPGGYFAYSSSEAYAQCEEDLKIWREMSTLVERICWKIVAKRNQTIIWVKPLTNECYQERKPGTQSPVCRSDDDPDTAWHPIYIWHLRLTMFKNDEVTCLSSICLKLHGEPDLDWELNTTRLLYDTVEQHGFGNSRAN
ncbi:hypothetical protein GIB67_029057 [Kingdonia uniflora]|uniref:Methyltransferase n=1 Tax=Kingdonia uniflora TaxID=39325 RepID=A0A7J7N7B0_9MAGN|nr:hypothetical protein GIB67_029057 [Kingdonia uniflora]